MRHFTTLDTMEHIKTFIQDHPLVLLYFSQPNCSVCHGLRPQVAELMAQYPNIQMGHINTHKVPAVAGHFSIFTVPVIPCSSVVKNILGKHESSNYNALMKKYTT